MIVAAQLLIFPDLSPVVKTTWLFSNPSKNLSEYYWFQFGHMPVSDTIIKAKEIKKPNLPDLSIMLCPWNWGSRN